MPRKKKIAHSPKQSQPIDAYVGAKIREARKALQLSQTDLGIALGVSFQQVQKYEDGRNRITVARLYQVSKLLKINIASLFADLPAELR